MGSRCSDLGLIPARGPLLHVVPSLSHTLSLPLLCLYYPLQNKNVKNAQKVILKKT